MTPSHIVCARPPPRGGWHSSAVTGRVVRQLHFYCSAWLQFVAQYVIISNVSVCASQ